MQEEPGGLFRNLSVYSALALITLLTLYLVWSALMGVHMDQVVGQDPGLKARVDQILKQEGVGEVAIREILLLARPRLDWFLLAFGASVLVFPVVGYLAGRFAPNPEWAGILPILDLLSGMNPVLLRVADELPRLPLHEQVVVLVVQVLCAQLGASLGRRRPYRPPSGAASPPPGGG